MGRGGGVGVDGLVRFLGSLQPNYPLDPPVLTIDTCLPIVEGWNYTVRLYRPRAEILDGSWKCPEPQISG